MYINEKPVGIAGPAGEPEKLLEKAVAGRECVKIDALGDYVRGLGFCDSLVSAGTDRSLHQYHYVKGGKDYWLLMNVSSYETVDMIFRLPEAGSYGVYDAMSDVTRLMETENGSFRLVLKPYQSTIICTDPEGAEAAEKNYELKSTTGLENFSLDLKAIASDETVHAGSFDLKPVSSVYRNFSGEMIYKTEVVMDKVPDKAVFAAQYVYECMSVEVNGVALPAVIAPPYEADLTSALKEGKNEICIHVVSTALRDANTKPGIFGKERTVLEPTGMFGSVEIRCYDQCR